MEAALTGPSGRTMLGASVLTIGRRADNALVIQDVKASSHHAEIRPTGDGYSIVDVGSTNGTFVNEQRIGPNIPLVLKPNDIIRIGDTRFTYEAQTVNATVFDAPQNNPAYLPTVAAGPSFTPPVQNNPASYPDYNAAPAYPPPEQNAPYGGTVAAPSPYTAYQGGQAQVPPPPAYDPHQSYQQAPSYYPPPLPYGQGQPAVQPSKTSGASLTAKFRSSARFRLYVIGAGVLVLLIIVISVVAIAAVGASSPTKTLTQYCNDFKAGDFNSAYDLLSSNVQAQVSRAEYVSTEQGVNKAGGVTNCSVTNVTQNDPSATGAIVYTFGNGQTLTARYTLVNQNGTWKISTENVPTQ